MQENYENDDALRALIKEEGLLSPSPDFTLKVMKLIEESKKQPIPVYEPLLSRKTWILIITAVVVLLGFSYSMPGNDKGDVLLISQIFKPVWDLMNHLDFSFRFNSKVLLIATFIISSVGVLLSIDIRMTNKNPGLSA